MKMTALSFNKTGYDPFIDFLKAFSIFSVILAHNLPTFLWDYCQFRLWAGMQVPMFILIQVFHAYKKEEKPTIKWTSLLKRIVIPFVLIQTVIFLFRLLSTSSFRNVLVSSAIGGGVWARFVLLLDIHTDGDNSSLDMAIGEKADTISTHIGILAF